MISDGLNYELSLDFFYSYFDSNFLVKKTGFFYLGNYLYVVESSTLTDSSVF